MTSRKAIRSALAALLTSGVSAVQAVYAYPKLDLDGESPILTISSGGSERAPFTMAGSRATLLLDLHILVLQSGPGWSEAQAEDALDDIEAQVYAVLHANRRSTAWAMIDYSGRTDARRPLAMPGGVVYLHEQIQIEVQVY